jgi:hypothetical protein
MPRCLSTPKLESNKARLVREQQARTARKVEALLRPRQPRQEEEVSDDSEEDNRLRTRRARANRDQATQKDNSDRSFCCGFFLGLCLVVLLLFFLVLLIQNEDKTMAKQGRPGA